MGDTIHIWKVPLEVDPAPWEWLLSPDELERARQFRRREDRRAFVVRRGVLRSLLGAYRGRGPASLRFVYGAHQKPNLQDGGCAFNVSRSDGLAVIAITASGRIGVDVERARPGVDLDAFAGEFMSTSDRATLDGAAPADRVRTFFRLWVRQEALVKATGDGLVVPADPAVPGAGGLWLRDIDLADGYVAALAADGDECREVVIRDFDHAGASAQGGEPVLEHGF